MISHCDSLPPPPLFIHQFEFIKCLLDDCHPHLYPDEDLSRPKPVIFLVYDLAMSVMLILDSQNWLVNVKTVWHGSKKIKIIRQWYCRFYV